MIIGVKLERDPGGTESLCAFADWRHTPECFAEKNHVKATRSFNCCLLTETDQPIKDLVPCSPASYFYVEVDRFSASVSVSAPNVDKWALSVDVRFRPKAVVPHSVHFRFRRAAVGKFGDCRK